MMKNGRDAPGRAFRYGLEELPPPGELTILGLQWLALSIPVIIILGRVAALAGQAGPMEQVAYIQKLFFVMAAAVIAQVTLGHRLPVVMGPSAALLIGVLASGSDPAAAYTAIFFGGALLSLLSMTGIMGRLIRFFTPLVVATILFLIAFTLSPTIIGLITDDQWVSPFYNLCFALVFVLVMFAAGRLVSGFWKSTFIIWSMIAGSLLHIALFGSHITAGDMGWGLTALFLTDVHPGFSFQPGVMISFIFCFLALFINDLGSMQSVVELVRPPGAHKRIAGGVFITGLGNMLAGVAGVLGPVNYTYCPGVIASSGVASRYTLLPAGAGLLALAFMPAAIAFMSSVPFPVIGCLLIYVMCSQIAAGLGLVFSSEGGFGYEDGLVVGIPLLLGTLITFLPAAVVESIPVLVRPLLSNGFVVGVLAVLVLEHLVFMKKQ